MKTVGDSLKMIYYLTMRFPTYDVAFARRIMQIRLFLSSPIQVGCRLPFTSVPPLTLLASFGITWAEVLSKAPAKSMTTWIYASDIWVSFPAFSASASSSWQPYLSFSSESRRPIPTFEKLVFDNRRHCLLLPPFPDTVVSSPQRSRFSA